jgi:hypothetical protein
MEKITLRTAALLVGSAFSPLDDRPRGPDSSLYRQTLVRRLLPEDPLVRWLFWLIIAISIGLPVLLAIVFALQE